MSPRAKPPPSPASEMALDKMIRAETAGPPRLRRPRNRCISDSRRRTRHPGHSMGRTTASEEEHGQPKPPPKQMLDNPVLKGTSVQKCRPLLLDRNVEIVPTDVYGGGTRGAVSRPSSDCGIVTDRVSRPQLMTPGDLLDTSRLIPLEISNHHLTPQR